MKSSSQSCSISAAAKDTVRNVSKSPSKILIFCHVVSSHVVHNSLVFHRLRPMHTIEVTFGFAIVDHGDQKYQRVRTISSELVTIKIFCWGRENALMGSRVWLRHFPLGKAASAKVLQLKNGGSPSTFSPKFRVSDHTLVGHKMCIVMYRRVIGVLDYWALAFKAEEINLELVWL